MRFRLRTLLIAVTLAAVIAAIVRVDPGWGWFTYAVCVSAYGMVWRIEVVLRRLDPGALSDSPVAHAVDILLVNAGVAVLATVAFYIALYGTVLFGMVIFPIGPEGHVRGLWEEIALLLLVLAIPFVSGNAAVIGCYWLSWPREEK